MSGERVERRLAAIMAGDIAGYSRLMGRDEEGTLRDLKELRASLLHPKIAEHRGRIVKTTGDGVLIEFPSVVDAMRCAVEIQRGMAERAAVAPADRRIELRMGINIGDIIIDNDDIYGDGVNVAARLEALAEPGSICVSRVVRDQVRDKLDVAFHDLGDHSVKNIARPVRVFRVMIEGAPTASTAGPTAQVAPAGLPALPDRPSIAVLPFQNMSGDPEQEYFVDGIVEDIITGLSRIKWLYVVARNSSFVYKGRAVDVKQAGRELGVRYVLEGSLRKSGNRVRVTAQLIEALTGTHVWAERYDRALDDIFEVQDEITINSSALSSRHCARPRSSAPSASVRIGSTPTICTCVRCRTCMCSCPARPIRRWLCSNRRSNYSPISRQRARQRPGVMRCAICAADYRMLTRKQRSIRRRGRSRQVPMTRRRCTPRDL